MIGSEECVGGAARRRHVMAGLVNDERPDGVGRTRPAHIANVMAQARGRKVNPVGSGDPFPNMPPPDYVLADQDGVVIIPRDLAAEVIGATETKASTETRMRDAIISGMDAVVAYKKFGVF